MSKSRRPPVLQTQMQEAPREARRLRLLALRLGSLRLSLISSRGEGRLACSACRGCAPPGWISGRGLTLTRGVGRRYVFEPKIDDTEEHAGSMRNPR
eukprot:522864-Alexandrium_andersonii.AAC.1